MIAFLQAALEVAPVAAEALSKVDEILRKLYEFSLDAGKHIIIATIVFVAGRFVLGLANALFNRMLNRRKVDPTVKSFLRSLVNILMMVLLIVSTIGALGVNTTSFAALLASAGVAIGMALSGNLSNFAGGIIILLFKPYEVGDYVEAPDGSGTVKEIQIFHTLLQTPDNKIVYVPNGNMSSGAVVNYNRFSTRRVEWVIGVDYGENLDKVQGVLERLLAEEERVLKDPAHFIALKELAASSVNVVCRAWVKTDDYWGVFFDFQRKVYDTFNAEGIDFPFPQQTVHLAK